jgi:hypothetical protein
VHRDLLAEIHQLQRNINSPLARLGYPDARDLPPDPDARDAYLAKTKRKHFWSRRENAPR